jgi:hypothetical protein
MDHNSAVNSGIERVVVLASASVEVMAARWADETVPSQADARESWKVGSKACALAAW